MGFVYAKNNGNWSDTLTWAGGILPVTGDEVYTNTYTVAIDVDIDVESISNDYTVVGVPGCNIPKMTSYTSPSGVVSASSESGVQYAYLAFDKKLTTYWSGFVNNGVNTIGYQYPTGKINKQYSFYSFNNNRSIPKDFTYEGSNDGITWTVLDTVTGNLSPTYYSGLLANTTSYTHYQLNISATNNTSYPPYIYAFDMTESTDVSDGYKVYGGTTVIGSRNINFSGNGLQTLNTSGVMTINSVNGDTVNLTTSSGGYVIGPFQQRSQLDINILIINNNPIVNITSDLYGIGYGYSIGYSRGGIFRIAGAATVNVIGNIYCSKNTNQAYDCEVINVVGTNAILNITGNIIGSTVERNYGGILINGASSVTTVIGNMETARGGVITISANGAQFNNIGTIRMLTVDSIPVIVDVSKYYVNPVKLSSPVINALGTMAVAVSNLSFYNTSNIQWTVQDDLGVDKVLTNAGGSSGVPLESDVRNGVTYGAASGLTGTLLLPAASDVRVNVPFDNTFGTADLTAQDFFTAIATSNDPIAIRMRNMSTIQTTASTVASFDV